MQQRMRNHNNLFSSWIDRTKLFATILIGISFFIFKIPSTYKSDFLQDTATWLDSSTHLAHHIAYWISLADLLSWYNQQEDYTSILASYCQEFLSCGRIHSESSLSTSQQSYYKLLSLKILTFIDSQLILDKSLQSTATIRLQHKKHEERRWYATHETIVINTYNLDALEFYEVLVHELGHIIDLGLLKWNSRKLDPDYTEFQKKVFAIDDPSLKYYQISRENEWLKKRNIQTKDFCSRYGSSDPFEDFAECFNLYINHNSYFKALSNSNAILQEKYNFIANLTTHDAGAPRAIKDNYNIATDHRYWDSTRIQ